MANVKELGADPELGRLAQKGPGPLDRVLP